MGSSAGNIMAHARCCDFTDSVSDIECIGYDRGVYFNGGDDVTSTVSCEETLYPLITGCSVYSPADTSDGSWANDIDRNAKEFETDYPITSQTCTARKGWQSGGVKATLSCCKSPTYDLSCVTRWGDFDTNTFVSKVSCSDGYQMTGCSAESAHMVAKLRMRLLFSSVFIQTAMLCIVYSAWYISDDDECIARSEESSPVYAVAICCRLDTEAPTAQPTEDPTSAPSESPSQFPSESPSSAPSNFPTSDPTAHPTADPTRDPTVDPTIDPTNDPTSDPTIDPTVDPTTDPTENPTSSPSQPPTAAPSYSPSVAPSHAPTVPPTMAPTPNCPALLVTVNDASGFDAAEFDGLYTNNGKLNNESTWEVFQVPDDKNIFYDGTQWIINSFNGSLFQTSDQHITDITTKWSHSDESGQFNLTIKCVLTAAPIAAPTSAPTVPPTNAPSQPPTNAPSLAPTLAPSAAPTFVPTTDPTTEPTVEPTNDPTTEPTNDPTVDPTADPTLEPTIDPTIDPTLDPTMDPTQYPTSAPSQPPSAAPTWSPTPYCPVINVRVWESKGLFNPEAYNGQYIMNPTVTLFGLPIWEAPGSKTDKNIHFTGDNWIINGANYGILSYGPTNSNYPPMNDLTAEWRLSSVPDTIQIELACIGSYHPTSAPTLTPTGAPTGETFSPTTAQPSEAPTRITRPPSNAPSMSPSTAPTDHPITRSPTPEPSESPTVEPTIEPTEVPTLEPTMPTKYPTTEPTEITMNPSVDPTTATAVVPTKVAENPTNRPTQISDNNNNDTAQSENGNNSSTLIFVIIGMAALILCLLCCFCVYYRRRNKEVLAYVDEEIQAKEGIMMVEVQEGIVVQDETHENGGTSGGTAAPMIQRVETEEPQSEEEEEEEEEESEDGKPTKINRGLNMLIGNGRTRSASSKKGGVTSRMIKSESDEDEDDDMYAASHRVQTNMFPVRQLSTDQYDL